MYRNVIKELDNWYNKKNKKPLIVLGARQIGKTYIIDEFCKNTNDNYINFDFLRNEEAKSIANIEDYRTMVEKFQFKYDIDFSNNKNIYFFDEIQEVPYLIQHLKYLCIDYPGIKIICAGSLLGVSFKTMKISFPVGYIEKICMYPMSFEEYLIATNNKKYIPIIEECYQKSIPIEKVYHDYLMEQYYRYSYLGGMPEVIKNYVENNMDLSKYNKKIISNIVDIYKEDMGKYIEKKADFFRIRRIYDNIVSQLSKENPKFQYAKLDKKDNRKVDYIVALDWLINSNIIIKCDQVTKPEYPLNAYIDDNAYKIYVNDVGILGYLANIEPINIVMNGDYSFKGKIAENYCLNELLCNNHKVLYYSEKDKGTDRMEIDFLIQLNGNVIPIEVKANKDNQSKSLKSYIDKFKVEYCIRISAKNFGYENKIKSVPLYATFCIK